MTDHPENGNTELVLPIICPHCETEIDLNMIFSLLPPKVEAEVEEDSIIEEEVDNGDESDEEEQ